MNINRKFQLAALAVVANGALALGLLSPHPALAATCGGRSICVSQFSCQNQQTQACNSIKPPGCTLVSSVCTYPDHTLCFGNTYRVLCNFQ